MIKNQPVYINGDGETSRAFCYIENTVQANPLAGDTCKEDAASQVYDVAVGDRTSLKQIYVHLRDNLGRQFSHPRDAEPIYRDFRSGDVRHSLADISKGKNLMGYQPTYKIREGFKETMYWYFGFPNLPGRQKQ